jgi:hypothetical protein
LIWGMESQTTSGPPTARSRGQFGSSFPPITSLTVEARNCSLLPALCPPLPAAGRPGRLGGSLPFVTLEARNCSLLPALCVLRSALGLSAPCCWEAWGAWGLILSIKAVLGNCFLEARSCSLLSALCPLLSAAGRLGCLGAHLPYKTTLLGICFLGARSCSVPSAL